MMYFIIIVNALVCSSEVKILKICTEKKKQTIQQFILLYE